MNYGIEVYIQARGEISRMGGLQRMHFDIKALVGV